MSLPDGSEQGIEGIAPSKRAFYIREIGEALAIGLLRDAQLFGRVTSVPGPMNKKRPLWDRARESMLDCYIKLFQLDKEHLANGSWKDAKSLVIDVPTNVKQVSDPQKPQS